MNRLALGGHSFIQQLGNDPLPTEDEQTALVAACLERGITWFDTTYLPERVALGRALERLGRRDEATILAWNFFVDFGPGESVGGPAAYRPEHLDGMLAELRTDRIDVLVVHGVGDAAEDRRQEELAASWVAEGRVRRLGVWAPGADAEERFGTDNPYSLMVHRYNLGTPDAAPIFAACKRLGWETVAVSPFTRGWELDKLTERVHGRDGGEVETIRARLADHMLRYSLFADDVDRLVVAMRRVEWVAANVASAGRGPLSEDERDWLGQAVAEY